MIDYSEYLQGRIWRIILEYRIEHPTQFRGIILAVFSNNALFGSKSAVQKLMAYKLHK